MRALDSGGIGRMKVWAKSLKRDVIALSLAMKHPRVPWPAKAVGALVIAYALSPIDLIPDFIPVLGLLDDLILVPAGLALVRRMVPREVMEECRSQAEAMEDRPTSRWGIAFVVLVWLLLAFLALRAFGFRFP